MWKFIGGFAVGLAGFCGLMLVSIAVSRLPGATAHSTPSAPLLFSGAAASRLGGTRVKLDLWQDVIREDCRGVCDDLGDLTSVRSVQITGADGKCILCRRVKPLGGQRIESAPLFTRGGHE